MFPNNGPAGQQTAAPAPAEADAAGGDAAPRHPLEGRAVIFVPPMNLSYPTLRQVPGKVVAVHDAGDVTVLTEDGTEYRCPLHEQPVEDAGSGLFAVLED